jgi:mono/diheme cytochrome c family protein
MGPLTISPGALVGLLLAVGATLVPGARAMEPGEALYLRYCGACHGPGGRGDGIAAPLMTPRPRDLTTIAQRNGGEFPMGAVLAEIDGRRTMPAHGTREMPIWGERFEAEASEPVLRHAEARGKLLLIAEYVRSLQR